MPETNTATETTNVPVVNPTSNGVPLIPVSWVKWLALVAAVCATIAGAPAMGVTFIPPAVVTGAALVLSLLTVVGIASPGARK